MQTLRIGIILAPRFTLNAFANFVDVLRLAADEGDGSRPIRCQWHVMSPTGKSVVASCGIEVTPTSNLIDPRQLDYIAVRGEGSNALFYSEHRQAGTVEIPLEI